MKAMVCEMCGSQDLVKQNGLFVCQACGTKYSVEEARKLMVEGTVKVDNSQEIENLLVLARRARDENNIENAEKYYEMVLQAQPNSWEPYFFQVYFKALQCKIIEISRAASTVANCIPNTVRLISEIPEKEKQSEALDTVIIRAIYVATSLGNAAINHYNSEVQGAFADCSARLVACQGIFENLELSMKHHFKEKEQKIVEIQKAEIGFINNAHPLWTKNSFFNKPWKSARLSSLYASVRSVDPTYSVPDSGEKKITAGDVAGNILLGPIGYKIFKKMKKKNQKQD